MVQPKRQPTLIQFGMIDRNPSLVVWGWLWGMAMAAMVLDLSHDPAVVLCGGVIIMADETNCCSMTDLRWWQTSDSLRGYRFAVGDDMA